MSDLDRERAGRLMREAGLDALVLFQPEHVAYAIGANPGVATMWRRGGGAVALVPSDPATPVTAIVGDIHGASIRAAAPNVDVRTHALWVDAVDVTGLPDAALATAELLEAGYARARSGNARIARPTTYDYRAVLHLLGDALADRGLGAGRIGADLEFLPAADFAVLTDALPACVWSDGSPVIRTVRAVKSPREIDRLRRACALAEHGLEALIAGIKPGRTARDLSIIWRGAVAAGVQSSGITDLTGTWDYISVGPDPWGGNGVIEQGSIIKADVGCLIGGYSSDSARTFVLGEPGAHAAELFAVIAEAFEAGLAKIRPGTSFREIYAATIEVFRMAGVESYNRGHFGHSLGASMGSEEWPFIAGDSTAIVEPGMVLAFEVPCYVKGIGALMIEDQLLVTETGIELMNTLPRGLTSIG